MIVFFAAADRLQHGGEDLVAVQQHLEAVALEDTAGRAMPPSSEQIGRPPPRKDEGLGAQSFFRRPGRIQLRVRQAAKQPDTADASIATQVIRTP